MKILVADDSKVMRQIVIRTLRQAGHSGHEIIEAENGRQAVELVHSEVLTPSDGLHGVRVIFDYELTNGVLHTFDQTALVNNAGTMLYLLIIRCSTSCYRDRIDELNTIATSFTVRSDA